MATQTTHNEEIQSKLDQALRDIRSTDVLTRVHAEDALAGIGAPAVEALIALSRDKSIKDKREIAEALGRIGDERATGALVDLVEVWIRAVEKYLSTHDLLDRDIEAELNAHTAIRALGKFGEPMLGYLEQISRKSGLVWGAVPMLAAEEAAAVRRKMAGKPDLRPFLGSGEFGDARIRGEALNRLDEIGDESALPGLEKLLAKFQGADKESIRRTIENIKQRTKAA